MNIYDPQIAKAVYEQAMETPITVTQRELLLHADYTYLSSTYVDKDQYEGQYLPGAVG